MRKATRNPVDEHCMNELHDYPLSILCLGMAETSAASSSASVRNRRMRSVWGWKCLHDGCQRVGRVCCGNTWHIDTVDKEAAEFIALGEALVDILNRPSGEDVEFIMNSSTNAFDLLFSTNPIRHKLCIQRLRQLIVIVELRRRIRWSLVDAVHGEDVFREHLMHYLSTSTPVLHSSCLETEDRLENILQQTTSIGNQWDEVHSEKSVSKLLVGASRMRFQQWLPSTSIPLTCIPNARSGLGWGTCGSISTFNLNRMPWHKLSDWLVILEGEVDFSLLALQEIFEETGTIAAGWYEAGRHKILVTRSHKNMLLGLVLHGDFAPSSLPDFVANDTSVITDIQIRGLTVTVAAIHFQPSGYDSVDPEAIYRAQSFITEHVGAKQHRLVMGDMNAWLGRSALPGMCLGKHNLCKTNPRGHESLAWIENMQLIVSSTHFPHAILATRCGYRNEESSIDYICSSPRVHALVQGCDVLPIASKSDHYLVRLQLKADSPARRKRGRRKLGHWENSDFCKLFQSALPNEVPCQMQEWQQAVVLAIDEAKNRFTQRVSRKRMWDERAKDLWERRKGAVGNERRELSKL
eukprot:5745253-Amphidinium_carterae.2